MKRDKRLCLRLSEKERELIRQKMKLCGCINTSEYMRKMAIDGMFIKVDSAELREISRLLGYNGKNINQIEKNLNDSNVTNANDMADIKAKQTEIVSLIRKIYLKLAKI